VKLVICLPLVLLLAACAGPGDPLIVKPFLLRDQVRDSGLDPMVRMEKERRLRGAVSMEERRQRLGQYYSLQWHDAAGAGQGEVEIVFQYRQGGSGSRVKRMSRSFASDETRGTAEFAVIGDDYFEGGRVLAWKATLTRGGREISSRRSYLWE
jgi:hypothetical protein